MTVYAAYHAYGGAKDIVVYPFNDHEGGLGHQRLAQINWLNDLIGSRTPADAAGCDSCFSIVEAALQERGMQVLEVRRSRTRRAGHDHIAGQLRRWPPAAGNVGAD